MWKLQNLCIFLCIDSAFSTFLFSVCRKILVAVLIPFSYLCFQTIVSIFVHTASRETGFFWNFRSGLTAALFHFRRFSGSSSSTLVSRYLTPPISAVSPSRLIASVCPDSSSAKKSDTLQPMASAIFLREPTVGLPLIC